jgi:aryl-alcohol dehydrogenase-like predicted oxidoreductase
VRGVAGFRAAEPTSLIDELRAIAAAHGVTAPQVALAWLL